MPKTAFLSLLFLLCLLLPACGVVDYFYLPPPEDTVQEIFETANDSMQEKRYVTAAKYFMRIKDEYPFSPYAIEAELSLGDAYFLNGDYLEAADAYREFESLHPRHPAMPYVIYQLALSLKLSYKSVDKTATEVTEAIEYFQRLMQAYPGTEYAAKAPEQIAECRVLLAKREVFIANVYWNMGNYQAAWNRYQYVVDNYADTGEPYEFAKTQGASAYLLYKEKQAEWERKEKSGGGLHKLLNWL